MDEWFIRVRSPRFAPRPGESTEIVNDGMYGRALGEYLTGKLLEKGHSPGNLCPEDWGWWLQLRSAPFSFAACIYCIDGLEAEPLTYAVTHSRFARRAWSWRRLRVVAVQPWVDQLREDLLDVFGADPAVELLGVFDEAFPAEPATR